VKEVKRVKGMKKGGSLLHGQRGPIGQLLAALDQAYDRQSWHGTNLKGSLRGLTVARASARPAPGRHNIWELAVHAAYWKYAVWRRLTGASRGSFPLDGSNWFERPSGDHTGPKAWKADVALLEQMHRQLRAAVLSLQPRDLARRAAGSRFTNADLITGVTAHDVYHAGQIQILKRLT
jgi:DinB family protein